MFSSRIIGPSQALALSVALCVSASCVPEASAQTQPYSSQQSGQPTANPGYFVVPQGGTDTSGKALIPLLLMTLQSQAIQAAGFTSLNFFGNWMNWLFGKIQPPSQTGRQQEINNQSGSITGNQTPLAAPTTQMQAQAVQLAIAQPMLALKAAFFDGPQANAQRHPQHGEVEIKSEEGSPVALTVYTGDVFALYFTPSTPGLVRLTSIDTQKTEILDTYVVKPGAINRLPREGSGGIVVDGHVGTETLRVEFEPCLPQALANDIVVQPFLGKLQRCFQLTAGAKSAAGAKSVTVGPTSAVTSRGMTLTVPASGDFKNTGVIGASEGFQPGRTMTHDITVNHFSSRL